MAAAIWSLESVVTCTGAPAPVGETGAPLAPIGSATTRIQRRYKNPCFMGDEKTALL